MKGYTPPGAPPLEIDGQTFMDVTTSESPLVILGKIIASDLILNNPDRVPVIWPNAGNERNLMCEILIDPQTYGKDFLFSNPKNLNRMNMINLVALDNKSYHMKCMGNPNNKYLKEYTDALQKWISSMFHDMNVYRTSSTYFGMNNAKSNTVLEHSAASIKPLNKLEFSSMDPILDFMYKHTKADDLFVKG